VSEIIFPPIELREQLTRIQYFEKAIIKGTPFKETLELILNSALELVKPANPDGGRIRLTDYKNKQLVLGIVTGSLNEADPELAVRAINECVVGRAAVTKKPQFVNDLQGTSKEPSEEAEEAKKAFKSFLKSVEEKIEKKSVPNWQDWEKYYNDCLSQVRTEIAIPLLANGQVLGVFNVHSKTPNVFNYPKDLNLLYEFAHYAVMAILQWQARVLTELGEIVGEMTSYFDLKSVANQLVVGIRKIFPEALVDLFSYDELRKEYTRINWDADKEKKELWEKEIKLRKAMPRRRAGLGYNAIKKKRFVFEEHVDWEDGKGSSNARTIRIKSTGCIPLLFKGKTVGVLYLHFAPRHYFTLKEKEALDLFASQAAVAISNVERMKAAPSYTQLFGSEFDRLFSR